MTHTNVYNIHNGVDTAYIYIWLSKSQGILYIGMTNNHCGPIGRAEGHFNAKGTFRKRFLQQKGFGVERVSDMVLTCFPLPKRREYTSEESSYRESVEYLVMKQLQIARGAFNPSVDIISWHDRTPKRTGNSEVIGLANTIVADFTGVYSSL